eukprot:3090846-Rhodomonas_salina.1
MLLRRLPYCAGLAYGYDATRTAVPAHLYAATQTAVLSCTGIRVGCYAHSSKKKIHGAVPDIC